MITNGSGMGVGRCLLALVPLLAGLAAGGLSAQETAPDKPAVAASEAAQEGGREMSVAELEAFIKQRREELEEVKASREETEAKAASVREAIDQHKAELARIENELKALCEDREKVSSGSYDKCMNSNGSDAGSPPDSQSDES